MKTLKLFLMATGVLFTSLTFQSCLDDDDNYYYGYLTPNALVTVNRLVITHSSCNWMTQQHYYRQI